MWTSNVIFKNAHKDNKLVKIFLSRLLYNTFSPLYLLEYYFENKNYFIFVSDFRGDTGCINRYIHFNPNSNFLEGKASTASL